MSQTYFVKSFDDDSVQLKAFAWSFFTVRLPRNQIASVEVCPMTILVRTTGGVTYVVNKGLRRKIRQTTYDAFPGVGLPNPTKVAA